MSHNEKAAPNPNAAAARFRSSLAAIKRRKEFLFRSQAPAFANQLSAMLSQFDEGLTDPRTRFDLLASFYQNDSYIFNICDDSYGCVGDVFRFQAHELFVKYAKQCADKDHVTRVLLELYVDDEYGVRGHLLDRASEFLPPELLQTLTDTCVERAHKEPSERYWNPWAAAAATLARQQKNPELFARACANFRDDPPFATRLDIASVYLECDRPKEALLWLAHKDGPEHLLEQQDSLLLETHRRLGNQREAAEVSLRKFRRYRTREAFEELVALQDDMDQTATLQRETELIFSNEVTKYTDLEFLVEMELFDAAERYVLERSRDLSGDYYDQALPLAESFAEMGRPVPATVLYRALLESIMGRRASKYYHHGVRYLRKLVKLAPLITDWKGLRPHDQYFQAFCEQHKNKKAFWAKYGPAPARHSKKS